MNIDERLKALIRSLEHLVALHHENEQCFARMMETVNRLPDQKSS